MPDVLCRPVGRHRHPEIAAYHPKVYSNSVKGRCATCGCEVWIGPRSLHLVMAGHAEPICDDCAVEDVIASGSAPGRLYLGNPE